MHVHGKIVRGNYKTWVEIREEVLLGLAFEDDEVVFYVQGHEAYRYKPDTILRCGYEQFPYFGGNQSAPHRVEIVINALASKRQVS